jgi:hypothetical protein
VEKIDLKKELSAFYKPSPKAVTDVTLPAFHFLMIDGQGDPNASPAFARAVETLYAVSYGIKFSVKRSAGGVDYAVMPLEGLWWADDPAAFSAGKRDRWQWTLMLMQPEFVTAKQVKAAQDQAATAKKLPAAQELRFEKFSEGRCAQTMHLGPFSQEGPTVQRVHDYVRGLGLKPRGKHHEIYLSDMRRGDAAKWKTVIRQPMGK